MDRAQRPTEAGGARAKRIEADPANAKITYATRGTGVSLVATEIASGKHAFTVDEPAAPAGGDDDAPTPVEYPLGALIGCQVVVYRLYAQRLGIQIDDIQIEAEGDLGVRGIFGVDSSVRPGFSEVRLTAHVTGPETQAVYGELLAAVEAHCPVQDLFANTTPVKGTVVKR